MINTLACMKTTRKPIVVNAEVSLISAKALFMRPSPAPDCSRDVKQQRYSVDEKRYSVDHEAPIRSF
jgi:hypothetical protein